MKTECYIGIDPGQTTGFAAWDARLQDYEELTSGTFWEMYEKVLIYPASTTVIFLEDPNLIKPTFDRRKGKSQMMKISQNVGMNKRDAQLLSAGLSREGYAVHHIKPSGRRGTKRKWTAETFMNVTGHHTGMNEHTRDAAMLVLGQPLIDMNRFTINHKTEAI